MLILQRVPALGGFWDFKKTTLRKMMVKSGLEKISLTFHVPLQRYLLTTQANSAYLSRFFCTGQQQL